MLGRKFPDQPEYDVNSVDYGDGKLLLEFVTSPPRDDTEKNKQKNLDDLIKVVQIGSKFKEPNQDFSSPLPRNRNSSSTPSTAAASSHPFVGRSCSFRSSSDFELVKGGVVVSCTTTEKQMNVFNVAISVGGFRVTVNVSEGQLVLDDVKTTYGQHILSYGELEEAHTKNKKKSKQSPTPTHKKRDCVLAISSLSQIPFAVRRSGLSAQRSGLDYMLQSQINYSYDLTRVIQSMTRSSSGNRRIRRTAIDIDSTGVTLNSSIITVQPDTPLVKIVRDEKQSLAFNIVFSDVLDLLKDIEKTYLGRLQTLTFVSVSFKWLIDMDERLWNEVSKKYEMESSMLLDVLKTPTLFDGTTTVDVSNMNSFTIQQRITEMTRMTRGCLICCREVELLYLAASNALVCSDCVTEFRFDRRIALSSMSVLSKEWSIPKRMYLNSVPSLKLKINKVTRALLYGVSRFANGLMNIVPVLRATTQAPLEIERARNKANKKKASNAVNSNAENSSSSSNFSGGSSSSSSSSSSSNSDATNNDGTINEKETLQNLSPHPIISAQSRYVGDALHLFLSSCPCCDRTPFIEIAASESGNNDASLMFETVVALHPMNDKLVSILQETRNRIRNFHTRSKSLSSHRNLSNYQLLQPLFQLADSDVMIYNGPGESPRLSHGVFVGGIIVNGILKFEVVKNTIKPKNKKTSAPVKITVATNEVVFV